MVVTQYSFDRSLASLWFDSANSKHPWYLGRVSKTIDKKLVAIEPPDEISRLPRSIIDHRGYYKGSVPLLLQWSIQMIVCVKFRGKIKSFKIVHKWTRFDK